MGRGSRSAVAPSPDRLLVVAAIGVLIAVGVAQVGDFLTFVRMIGVAGIGAELNPIISRGAETVGVTALLVVKIALVTLVASVFAIVARHHRRIAALVATFGTVAGLVGAFSNVLAIA